MKTKTSLVVVGAAALSLTLGAVEEWKDPAVNGVNRLEAHAYALPLERAEDAFTAAELTSFYAMSLNGTWKFKWCGEPAQRPVGFERPAYDVRAWSEIDVPSCVEMRGYGVPFYTNSRNPFPEKPPFVEEHYNPVSSYRRTFVVPKGWAGRQVFVRFDGVASAYYLYLNGKKVGYAEDSKLPSTFDLTPYLKDGENLMAVEVYRWSDGSYLEDQDMFRYSGIIRDVTLYAAPKDGIRDFVVTTAFRNNYTDATIGVKVTSGAAASCTLYDANYKAVATFTDTAEVKSVNAWSAEKPYLYTLVMKAGADVRSVKVGFKEVKKDGWTMLVNGKHIKLKGVNRHETSPENGRALTRADMERDVLLMKRYNINCVRTSHYPDHRYWYELCDRYGIYVVAEANVEAHAEGYAERRLGNKPMWEKSIVERNANHVKCYRNHACVTMWSLGNETGHGDNFRKAYRQVKANDPQGRPVHWERGNPDADVDSRMYPTVEWLYTRGQVGEGKAEPDGENKKWAPENWHTAKKPFFMCEYAHAMGNAIGNFQEYWEAFYSSDSLWGGCIWDWIDQAVWKYTDRVNADGSRERFLAYGGDFDELPNDGPFCCNGVIGPTREVTPKLVEVGHVHRNLVVTLADAKAREAILWNRFGFTDANEFNGTWELVRDGETVDSGTLDVPAVKPLSKGALKLPDVKMEKAGEYFLNVYFRLKKDTIWAKKGHVVAADQLALGKVAGGAGCACKRAAADGTGKGAVKVCECGKQVVVKAGGTEAHFCRKTGTLWKLIMNGKTILEDKAGIAHGPRLTCARAFTDNDIYLRGYKFDHYEYERDTFYGAGMGQLRYHPEPIDVGPVWDDFAVVTTVVNVDGAQSAGFKHVTQWKFLADGTVEVLNTSDPHGKMPQLPRLGCTWTLDPSLEKMTWYGRGPDENYIDRKTGSFIGLYESTVTDQYVDYVRPQDNGYKCDVRQVTLTDANGKGVRFELTEPGFVQALHCTAEDMDFARHRNGERRMRSPVVMRPEVILNLDCRQLGLGGGSCGPRPMTKYMFPNEKTTWGLRLVAVGD